jgi:molybdopterin converting factor small subunit
MRIDIRLGSGLAQLAGGPRLEVDVAEGATVDDLLHRVAEARPALAPGLPSTLTVVRGSQVGADRVLQEGEEVALLMPVAGGQDLRTGRETWQPSR